MGGVTHMEDIRGAVERNPAICINEHYEIRSTRHGLMLLNRHDSGVAGAVSANGEWAWEEIARTIQFATGVVIDIGANIGTHTLVYARTAEHVFAFEPLPFEFDNLCANLLLNSVLNVTPVQCALGSYDGHTTMRIQEPTVTNSPAGCRVGEGESTVAMHRLDALGIPSVSFIKIDVETHELEVLKGAVETLKRDKPAVYVEIHYPRLIQPIVELMHGLGYAATPLVLTHVNYPDTHAYSDDDMLDVYGYLFIAEAVPHD